MKIESYNTKGSGIKLHRWWAIYLDHQFTATWSDSCPIWPFQSKKKNQEHIHWVKDPFLTEFIAFPVKLELNHYK